MVIAITGSNHKVMLKSLRSKQECGQDAVRKVAAPACLALHASVSSILEIASIKSHSTCSRIRSSIGPSMTDVLVMPKR
jgi:hypothetical protein